MNYKKYFRHVRGKEKTISRKTKLRHFMTKMTDHFLRHRKLRFLENENIFQTLLKLFWDLSNLRCNASSLISFDWLIRQNDDQSISYQSGKSIKCVKSSFDLKWSSALDWPFFLKYIDNEYLLVDLTFLRLWHILYDIIPFRPNWFLS